MKFIAQNIFKKCEEHMQNTQAKVFKACCSGSTIMSLICNITWYTNFNGFENLLTRS